MTQPLALIIEDDEKLATIFALAVREANYETEIIRDGDAALARLAVTRPSLVVLDLHLPHVSGQSILKKIRADDRLAETKVMLATADALRAENLREQADLVFLKPIDFNQLHQLAVRLRPADTTDQA